jgi:type VI secretion system secreted protein Hcp
VSPHRYLRLALPTAAILGVGGAIAVAAIPAADGTINGCYNTSSVQGGPTGQLRIVDDPSQCTSSSEKAIHWNQQGPQGPPGPQGQKGDQGAAATTPTPTPVAQTFLKFTGIPGSSTVPGHVGDIEVRSFSWGLSTTGGSGGGGGAGKAKFHDLHFSKGHDKASAELYRAAGTGQHFSKAVFSVVENGQEKIRYNLYDVTVRSFETSDGFLTETESVALAPQKVQLLFNDNGTHITQTFAVSHHGKAVVRSLSLKSRAR